MPALPAVVEAPGPAGAKEGEVLKVTTHTRDWTRSATISPDGVYRYQLTRERWPSMPGANGTVAFIMLNPSTADETHDDPTIRRCIGFADRWGFARLVVVNLFAFRATDPRDLRRASREGRDIVGPDNDRAIRVATGPARLVVAAWGNYAPAFGRRPGDSGGRDVAVRALLADPNYYPQRLHLSVLGFTRAGYPRHPLFVRGDVQPMEWDGGKDAGVEPAPDTTRPSCGSFGIPGGVVLACKHAGPPVGDAVTLKCVLGHDTARVARDGCVYFGPTGGGRGNV